MQDRGNYKVTIRLDVFSFSLHIGTALLLGIAIGLERQFRQHTAGLRTNTLVCVGAALFASLGILLDDKNSPTRMASYVVSGVGFLGGGVILREGLNVRGMSTAATLWSSAAVGVLAGSGLPAYATIGAAVILIVHLGLRPLAQWIDAHRKTAIDVETSYRMHVVCEQREEALIRTILLRHTNIQSKMTTQGISTRSAEKEDQALVVAEIVSLEQQDGVVQDIVNRLNIEPSVKSVRWEKVTQQPA